MTGNRAIKHWTLLLLSCCILLPSLLRAEEARGRESILIISSYNPDTRRMSSFITEFERQVVASGVPCDIYVETLECKSINDAPLWISQTDNLITRYESKGGLRAIVLLVLLLIFVAFLFLRTRRLKRTLEEREGQLVIAREKAEESDMLKSAFLANMSHEIRTPLNAIVGFSSLMQGEELSQEERAEYCAIVVNNSEMLLTLLNDILDISSLECGKIRFNYSAEEIVQICQHILMTTAHTRQPGVEGRLECAVDSYMLTTDVHRLSQILINLLTNAAKFTSEGSITLGVEICSEQNEVLFSVTDTGPGIPLDKQEMVFNRFEKLDGNKKKGTGLGLAICRQIAMIFGGRIWVDPTYTGGARFIFAHPIGLRLPEDREHREGGGSLRETSKTLRVADDGSLVRTRR